MAKKILYVDLDRTIANFDKGIHDIDPTCKTDWSNQKRVLEICHANPEFFHHLEPIEGAIDAMHTLYDRFDLRFASVPMESLPTSFTGKFLWLQKHLGVKASERLVLTHDKSKLIGDYLIDDSLRFGVHMFQGHHVHFATPAFPNWKVTLPYMLKFPL